MNAASPFAHDRAPTEYILIMPKYGVLPVLQVLRTDYSVLRIALVVHMYLRTKEYLYFCVGLPFCQTVDVRSTSTCIRSTPYSCNQLPTPGARKRKRSSEALVVSYCEA